MPIRLLPPDVAAKIAAGEVVERPVSVVKELLENAIDAGAADIRVELLEGGRRLIRVSDDGCGIPAAEVGLAFARHATSKLSAVEDLFRVRTLGFRGEALASIAAVSRLTLSTRARGEEVGAMARLEGGEIVTQQSQGRPQGTTVQVENLFYNTPARLKFLRSDPTEAGHIARLISSYALAYPEKRLTLEHNGRLVARTLGTGKLFDALVALYGLDVAEQTLEIPCPEAAEGAITVWGYIGAPALLRSDRRDILFFVNRRWIQDNALTYAVSEAYRTLLPTGRYPLATLNIALPPEEVDVNIHPTKREVRFRREREVFSAVQKAVRTTLMAQHPTPVVAPPFAEGTAWQQRQIERQALSRPAEQARLALDLYHPAEQTPIEGERSPFVAPAERLPMLRVLGQIAQNYIIAEGPGGLYLIDQHAAHERIRYEELTAQRARQGAAAQTLLDPLPIELSPQQAIVLEAHLEALAAYGLEIIPFGGNTFLVKSAPASLATSETQAAVVELLDAALEGDAGFSWEEQALITLSCHTAVRAGQTLSLDEMRDLVRQLERAALPHTCPHGRPTMIHLTQAQLEKEFGRR